LVGLIAYSYRSGTKVHGIAVIRSDGTHKRQVTALPASGPAWSPNAKYVAFSAAGGRVTKIFTVRPDGTGQQRLTGGATCFGDSLPDWSPDSQDIVFQRDECDPVEVWSVDRHGGTPTLLSGTTDYETTLGAGPRWSPDGDHIAFFRSDEHDRLQIYVMNQDGSNKTALTSSPGESNVRFPQSIYPDWAPTSSELIYTKVLAGTTQWDPTESDVCKTALVAGTETCLTETAGVDEDPHYSPSGDQIVFVSNRDGNRNIFVMNSDGSDQRAITTDGGADFDPQWSPDGTTIAFLSDRGGQVDLYVVNSDGSDLRRLTNSKAEESSPEWRPF
jgi:TolB protein